MIAAFIKERSPLSPNPCHFQNNIKPCSLFDVHLERIFDHILVKAALLRSSDSGCRGTLLITAPPHRTTIVPEV